MMSIETSEQSTISKPDRFDNYYEYTMENSNKFWAFSWDGRNSIDIYWGRIDSDRCRTLKKTFGYVAEAQQWIREKTNEKLNKGYA